MKHKDLFFEWSSLLLLFSLVGAIFVVGLFSSPEKEAVATDLFFTGILIFGVGTLGSNKGRLHRSTPFAVALLVSLYWLASFFRTPLLQNAVNLLMVIFLFAITFRLIVWLTKKREVDFEVLLEALNGYLLIGLSGAIVYMMIVLFHGGASFSTGSDGAIRFSDMVYFSFVTLCSIGFGDILPVSPLARSATLFFGIVGQLYTTFLVAFLIGQFVPRK